MAITAVDEDRMHEFMGRMIGYVTGSAVCFGIWLGDELGFYRCLGETGSMSSDELAKKTRCAKRLVREWLDGQVAASLIDYDSDADTYRMTPEAVMALADEQSPVFTARAMNTLGAMSLDIEKVKAAYRGTGAMRWADHHPYLFLGTEWLFRTGYRAFLPSVWIPALDGVEEKLSAGARVADVGCGHGASVIVMAGAYPSSRFAGFDLHGPSIKASRERALEAGVTNRVTFDVADAKGYDGMFDLICFFDCLHDMGDPVGVAAYALEHLEEDGTVLLVEPFALDDRTANLTDNPMAALLYHASCSICTPNALSQEVGLALGAQAGEARLREVFEEAGYRRFRRVAETPLNLILEARP